MFWKSLTVDYEEQTSICVLQLWICFLFHKSWSSERVCRVLATSVLQTTHFGFRSERLFIRGKLILPSQRSWRLTDVLQVEDVLNHCHGSGWWHLHVWFPLLCLWVFHLMFPNSPWSQRNIVWAEIKCFGFCGDHLICAIHSYIYLPFRHMKPLNFTPTPTQWFPLPLPQAC